MNQEKVVKKSSLKMKVLGYTLFSLLVLLVGAGSYLYFEYKKLQPQNYFQNVPVIGEIKPVPSGGVFNVLLLGSDTRKENGLGHTDSMMLVHVDVNKKQYKMISIPRDSRVYLNGYGYTKITSAQYIVQSKKGLNAGVQEAVNQVSKLTGLTINYYAETSFWGFQDIVNTIGSITMDVPFEVTITHPWYPENMNKVIPPGTYTFDGKMVTEITHERYSLPGTDFGRQRLQAEAMMGVGKAVEDPKNLSKLPELVKLMPSYLIATNMSTEDMLSLALAAKGFQKEQAQYFQIPCTGKTMFDDVLGANNSQLIINQEALQKIISENFMN